MKRSFTLTVAAMISHYDYYFSDNENLGKKYIAGPISTCKRMLQDILNEHHVLEDNEMSRQILFNGVLIKIYIAKI